MPLVSFGGHTPKLDPSVFVAPNAWLTGQITAAAQVSFFFGVVARGDIEAITIAERTNLQEHVLLHTSRGRSPCILGQDITVGHRAIVHGAKVDNCCLVGMGATILDDAEIGEFCIIGAHTLITAGTIIPPGSMVLGSPGKVVRAITDLEREQIIDNAKHYVQLATQYKEILANQQENP